MGKMRSLIMIVDDDRLGLETARGMLKDKYEVAVANSGALALKLLERQMPDLMILDIRMPDMDGLELMDHLQAHPLWRTIPVMFLTADTNSNNEVECLRKGAVDFVHKPFEVEVMLSRVNRILKSEENRKELERQWQNIHNMVSVEEILFDAHRTENGIDNALQVICEAASADRVFIMKCEDEMAECVKEWCAGNTQMFFEKNKTIPTARFKEWMERLQCRLPISITSVDAIKEEEPCAYEFLVERSVENFAAVPIYFSDNTFFGFLGVENSESNFHSVDMLCFMSLGFSMAFENMEEHKRIEKMGMYDFNTGVLNRNSYLDFLHRYEGREGDCIGCVFADVNGLHEINNLYGHKKGDEMLQCVADSLLNVFPKSGVYRVGGDEFVVFAENMPLGAIEALKDIADKEIRDNGYRVSFGIEWRDKNLNLDEIVKAADKKMYEAKANYYKEIGKENRR